MRKINILFMSLLILGVSVTSCSSNDNNDKVSNDDKSAISIVGKWGYSKIAFFKEGVNEELQDYHHNTGCGKDYIEFLSDGTYNDVYFLDDDNDDIDDDSDKCIAAILDGQYIKEGSMAHIKIGSKEDQVSRDYKILILDKNTLKIKWNYSEWKDETLCMIAIFKRI